MLLGTLTALACAALGAARNLGGRLAVRDQTDGLQDVVTWDEFSLKINGSRIFIWSGEVHPYRMPVQSLHLDIFQKVKSIGLDAVSFYVFWGIHEPKRGEISFEGFRDLQPFIDAAREAGVYLIARPGPYINAETTAGGFPGWGTYTPGLWRTSNTTYVDAWKGYMASVGDIIAKNEVTKGGPIILVQSENEYTGFASGHSEDFTYEKELLDAIRAAGVTVPTTFNDANPSGHYLSVDIWGYDSYPNGFDCSHPTVWSSNAVPEAFWADHLKFSPNKPHAVYEFQGGAFDGWGGSGYDTCAVLTGPEFERVFYKNELAMGTTMLSLYMIFGGTNWGGIAHPGVYTSYDYGSAIAETRVLREKYYELKLEAAFARASKALLTARPQNVGAAAQGAFTGNAALKTVQSLDAVGNKTGFYVVRQTDASIFTTQEYTITVPTSEGNITVPQLGGNLELRGKDSKIHVVDYEAGKTTLLYSTAEVMTWATIDGRDVIVLYGNTGELHETALKGTRTNVHLVNGSAKINQKVINGSLVLQYTTAGKSIVSLGDKTLLYLLDRANAYDFWVMHPADESLGPFAAYSTANPILIKGGYFLRSVSIHGGTLAIVGDLNATASFEIVAPATITTVSFNGRKLSANKTPYGTLVTSSKTPTLPAVTIPDIQTGSTWKVANSLPEISAKYSDTLWPIANHTTTVNPTQPKTPVVLYAGDYGFHTGNILWRAHFNASGTERGVALTVQGGAASGFSVWLDDAFIGSWVGDNLHTSQTASFDFNGTTAAGEHVLTVLQDHMGYEEDFTAASETFKAPRGILSFEFMPGNVTQPSEWRVTGNLGGESYADTTRGPLNEGGLFGERQGWHLPGFDDSEWEEGLPTDGISEPGVSFYRTTFDLAVPEGVDYPIGIVVTNSTTNPHFRSQFYVNGYQFGKYVNHVGPQKVFPVPQGILNYSGTNTLAVSLWAMDEEGAKLDSIALQLLAKVESSMAAVTNQPMPAWTSRAGAY